MPSPFLFFLDPLFGVLLRGIFDQNGDFPLVQWPVGTMSISCHLVLCEVHVLDSSVVDP